MSKDITKTLEKNPGCLRQIAFSRHIRRRAARFGDNLLKREQVDFAPLFRAVQANSAIKIIFAKALPKIVSELCEDRKYQLLLGLEVALRPDAKLHSLLTDRLAAKAESFVASDYPGDFLALFQGLQENPLLKTLLAKSLTQGADDLLAKYRFEAFIELRSDVANYPFLIDSFSPGLLAACAQKLLHEKRFEDFADLNEAVRGHASQERDLSSVDLAHWTKSQDLSAFFQEAGHKTDTPRRQPGLISPQIIEQLLPKL